MHRGLLQTLYRSRFVAAGPFSHRMMMTMEEKGISYHKNLLDEQKMPDW